MDLATANPAYVEAATVHVACVRLVGGLGNQMFGAAAAMAVAQRLHGSAEFDLSSFDPSSGSKWVRRYELEPFRLPARVFAQPPRDPWLQKLVGKRRREVPPGWKGSVWRERAFHYDASFEDIRASVYLIGYFQSPRYFEQISDRVRRGFSLEPLLSAEGKRLAGIARGEDSVAVHVRRGDYVANPKATAHHGIMGADYYRRAIDIVGRIVARPRLIVISDDPAAARELLSAFPDAHFVTGTTHFDDMHLISACRHRIIANSSFSWWGAWLDGRLGGITIAPRAWLSREQMLKTYIGDLLPQGWLLV